MNRKDRRAAGASASASSPAKLFDQAVRHHAADRFAQAITLYRAVLAQAPNEPEVHYNLGMALAQSGHPDQAVACWRTALSLRPLYPKASNNLGMTLAELGQLDEALSCLRFAAALAPEVAEITGNLAAVLRQTGAWDEAEALLRRTLCLDPAYADAYNNLGILEADRRRLGPAVTAYRRALRLAPGHAKAHFNLGLALLTQGALAEGWAEHEWRFKGGGRHSTPRPFRRPLWQGESLAGRRLLLHAEQGFGDSLQFLRFAQPLAATGATVLVEVPPALVRLAKTVPGVAQVVASGDDLPAFDRHLPMLSLPHLLGVTLTTIPAQTPYLSADPQAVAMWRQRLAPCPRPWVGLVWAGDPRPDDPFANAIDRRRSIGLTVMAPLLALEGVTFVSLQKGAPAAQTALLAEGQRLLDWTGELTDFADTAALTQALDLVITVDTAVAHLAGALNRPVWIASRFDGCWRWLEDRDDSPWYPTARLYRQTAPGPWDQVVASMAADLAGLVYPSEAEASPQA
jgi:tetratricopeptide (TPR) repeat protein